MQFAAGISFKPEFDPDSGYSLPRPVIIFNLNQMVKDAVKLRMWYGSGNSCLVPKGVKFLVEGYHDRNNFNHYVFKFSGVDADARGFTELALSGGELSKVSATRGVPDPCRTEGGARMGDCAILMPAANMCTRVPCWRRRIGLTSSPPSCFTQVRFQVYDFPEKDGFTLFELQVVRTATGKKALGHSSRMPKRDG